MSDEPRLAEPTVDATDLYRYVLRHADTVMILSQRLSGWVGHAPELEEDIALTNIALDLLGQARSLYAYAAELSDDDTSDDDLVFMRDERHWVNALLVEQPNGNFADTIVRQALFDHWHHAVLTQLVHSKDAVLSAVAAKSVKEVAYHRRHSSSWVERLGGGTTFSNARAQDAVDELWRFTPELFMADDLDGRMLTAGVGVDLGVIEVEWRSEVDGLFARSELQKPVEVFPATGGRDGMHTQHMGYLLAEMQILARSMPGCTW